MQYYRSDFEDETYFRRHPHITKLIWCFALIGIACGLAYLGGIEYLIN